MIRLQNILIHDIVFLNFEKNRIFSGMVLSPSNSPGSVASQSFSGTLLLKSKFLKQIVIYPIYFISIRIHLNSFF